MSDLGSILSYYRHTTRVPTVTFEKMYPRPGVNEPFRDDLPDPGDPYVPLERCHQCGWINARTRGTCSLCESDNLFGDRFED